MTEHAVEGTPQTNEQGQTTGNIRLTGVRFSEIPFRRLGSINFKIAPRMTLIAGRNGVGKSTILALISNASGITRGKRQTYFGKLPQGNLHEVIRLSPERDFVESEALKPNVFLTYEVDGASFDKRCNVTVREEGLRIVPRNEPKGPRQYGERKIPADGKVPIPTIYLGMTRLFPVGEAEPGSLQTGTLNVHSSDSQFHDAFTNRIISTGIHVDAPEMTSQSVKGTSKMSVHPPYGGYDSTAVSMGQDSLSSIATALASFQQMQRDMKDYPGGILVIDEIDAGFHPHAQIKLFNELKREARRLNLQIIATTHSLTMLSEAHKSISSVPSAQDRQDAIVYLQGGNPVDVLEVEDYQSIHDDMFLNLSTTQEQQSVKVYVEDDEAALFLSSILTKSRISAIEKKTKRKVKILSTRLGANNLIALHKADDYFHSVIVVLDGDVSVPKVPKAKNFLRLPKDDRVTTKQSPEVLIEALCQSLVSSSDSYPETRKLLKKSKHSTDHVKTWIIDLQANESESVATVATDREHAKKWFTRRLDSIKKLKLVEGWIADNSEEVNSFLKQFEEAVEFAALRAPTGQAVGQ